MAAGDMLRGDATGDCCDSCDQPRSHDTSRIAWAKLMAREGRSFHSSALGCGGDIRLIAFITDPGPTRKHPASSVPRKLLGTAMSGPRDSPANGTSATMSIGISEPMGGW